MILLDVGLACGRCYQVISRLSGGENMCKACDGTGLLSDDEGWKYHCTLCDTVVVSYAEHEIREIRILDVDENNRLVD